MMPRTSNSPGTMEAAKAEQNNSGDIAWRTSTSPGLAPGNSNENLPRGDRSLFSDWASLTGSSVQAGRRSVGNMSEIWEPANMGGGNSHDTSSKWPSSFENSSGDATAVGSGTRVGNPRLSDGLGDLGFCPTSTPPSRNADVPQSHREVEVSLFRTFTTWHLLPQNLIFIFFSTLGWTRIQSIYFQHLESESIFIGCQLVVYINLPLQ